MNELELACTGGKLAEAFGVEVRDRQMAIVIPSGVELPIEKTEIFSTAEDRQTVIPIHLLAGRIGEHRSLGRVRLEGFSCGPRGTPEVRVTFRIEANGDPRRARLVVTAVEDGQPVDIVR